MKKIVIALITMVLGAGPIAAAGNGQWVNVKGAKLWYEVRGGGRGTPLMVLNGGPGVSHEYMLVSAVWDSLARHRRVIFYDQRGTGLSPALAKGQSCTLADQISDLDSLRSHLGFQRMDLLGHSWGGILAMAYAARHPRRIEHLIVCDSGAPKWDDTKFLFRDLFPDVSERQDALQFSELQGDTAALHADFREYQSMLACDPSRRALLRDGPLPMYSPPVNAAVTADLRQFDLGPELPKFAFPTLVLTGRFDANVAPAIAWKIHRSIPRSEFTVFERSGHLPFFEEPAAFIERVERFLSSGGAAIGR